jgi:polyisoprenoid-binding protein YceI
MLALAVTLLQAASGSFVIEVEPNHSTIGFTVPIVSGMTRVTGKFNRFEMRMVFQKEDVSRWSVEATIEAASIDTGIDERDRDLRGPSLFDTEAHPRIDFVSRRIERQGDGYVARGELSMKGVSRALEVPFRLTALKWDGGAPYLGLAAALILDRNEYGVGTGWKHTLIPNFIGEEVRVEIFLWFQAGKARP